MKRINDKKQTNKYTTGLGKNKTTMGQGDLRTSMQIECILRQSELTRSMTISENIVCLYYLKKRRRRRQSKNVYRRENKDDKTSGREARALVLIT